MITMWEEWENFETVEFDNHAGCVPRFLVISSFHTQSSFYQIYLGKSIPKIFPLEARSKTSFLTSATAVDPSIKSQNYEVYWASKPKITPSLLPCKYHSIHLGLHIRLSIHVFKLLQKDNSVKNNQRNLQVLATKIFKA